MCIPGTAHNIYTPTITNGLANHQQYVYIWAAGPLGLYPLLTRLCIPCSTMLDWSNLITLPKLIIGCMVSFNTIYIDKEPLISLLPMVSLTYRHYKQSGCSCFPNKMVANTIMLFLQCKDLINLVPVFRAINSDPNVKVSMVHCKLECHIIGALLR